jgi:hypothetical protein
MGYGMSSWSAEQIREWIWQYHKSIDGAVQLPDGSTLIAGEPLLLITVNPVEIVRTLRP